jgi:hypothetical protein
MLIELRMLLINNAQTALLIFKQKWFCNQKNNSNLVQ